ncbi:ArsR family transcriptional regulator [Mycobacterium tuberculosis]|nr:ArsR family transcriptional regulator [Mycobacterium tuberculosis]
MVDTSQLFDLYQNGAEPSVQHLFDICQGIWQGGPMPKSLPVIDISAPVCCAPVAAGPMSDGDALAVALRLKALADPARVKIMSYLFSSPAGEQVSGQLAAALSLSDGTVSHHLAQLRKAGLVISDRRGMHVFHRVHPEALQALCTVLNPNCCA